MPACCAITSRAAVTQHTERALKRGYRYLKLHQIDVASVKAARDVAGT